jgi:hypothetical protein
MAWWRLRRGSRTPFLDKLETGSVDPEVAQLRLIAELPEGPDGPPELTRRLIAELEEGLRELEAEYSELVMQHLGPGYVPGRLSLEEGSILLIAPIHSVAETVVYYVAARQALEYLLRDFRATVNRWFRRFAHIPVSIRVTQANVVVRPILREASRTTGPQVFNRDALLTYLVVSHAVMLLALLTAGAFLLAHVI